MTTVLLTGFEPFAGASRNPSWDAVRRVADAWSGPAHVETVRLPVAFTRAGAELAAAVDRVQPDVVIAVGLAEGRTAITPERVAVNLDDARIPDADGAQPLDEPIDPTGPVAYFSSLPIKRMVQAAHDAGAPAALSGTAGNYVCNHVFYVLQDIAARHPDLRSGFVHVPATPEMLVDAAHTAAAPPVVELDVLVRGLDAAVRAAIDPAPDARTAGGAIS